MYFFKADISSFDDEAETVFIIPEQNADENGVPFEEKMITQTVEYKAFVKRTKTALVDCTYTQYQTDEPIADGLNSEKFAQLETEGKLAVIDANTYSISTGKSAKSKGKKNFTTYLIIGGIAVATVILIAVSALSGGDKMILPLKQLKLPPLRKPQKQIPRPRKPPPQKRKFPLRNPPNRAKRTSLFLKLPIQRRLRKLPKAATPTAVTVPPQIRAQAEFTL